MTMAGLSVQDLEGGSKSWKPDMGDEIEGTIVAAKRVQQTDFQTKEPLTWSNGDPRMQTVIELQTDLRDGDDDDGVRSIWLKGGNNFEVAQGKGFSGERALAEAAKAAGVKDIDEGATLRVKCSGLAKPTTRGFQPAKLYVMELTPGKASVPVSDLFDD
jgi:hypothetical protein